MNNPDICLIGKLDAMSSAAKFKTLLGSKSVVQNKKLSNDYSCKKNFKTITTTPASASSTGFSMTKRVRILARDRGLGSRASTERERGDSKRAWSASELTIQGGKNLFPPCNERSNQTIPQISDRERLGTRQRVLAGNELIGINLVPRAFSSFKMAVGETPGQGH